MNFGKKEIVFIISVVFLFSLAACAKGESPSMGKGTSGMEPTPPNVVEKEDPPIEESVSGEETLPKDNKYIEVYKAYMDILTGKREGIRYPGNLDGEVAILDAFGDETPELLFTYWHDYTDDKGFTYPVHSLKIFIYSKPKGAELVFDSVIEIAAGGPNNYCVFLSHEKELMLYRSCFGFETVSWGVWQITPNHNIEISSDGNYGDDSAILYYLRFVNDKGNNNYIYMKNGEEISKERYDKAAMEIIGNIDRIIFQNVEPEDDWDVLWKDIAPLEAENMTYDEAVAWLEAQIGNQ